MFLGQDCQRPLEGCDVCAAASLERTQFAISQELVTSPPTNRCFALGCEEIQCDRES